MAPRNPSRAVLAPGLVALAAALSSACGGDAAVSTVQAKEPAAPRPEVGPTPAEAIHLLREMGYFEAAEDPADPNQSGVEVYDADAVAPGFSLYTAAGDCEALLLDNAGNTVHSWSADPADTWMHADLLPNGDLLVPVRLAASEEPPDVPYAVEGSTGEYHYLLRLGWDGRTKWRAPVPAHHDAEQMPSGEILTLTSRMRHDSPLDPDVPILDNGIAKLSSDGELLDEVSLVDVLHAAPDFELVPTRVREGGDMDLLHTNSVEVMTQEHLFGEHPLYDPEHVLISMRHQDTVAIIHLGRRELVWAWGRGEISGQHDARLLPSGNLLIFDNGLDRKWSRVVELDPRENRIVWTYGEELDQRFLSAQRGSSQRLPNGNTLIADSNSGEAFEVTPDGRKVWAFWNPRVTEISLRKVIARAVRYPVEWFDDLPFAIEASLHDTE